MEIAIFVLMMIVPFVSVAALVLSISTAGKVKAQKAFVASMLTKSPAKDDPMTQFRMMDM